MVQIVGKYQYTGSENFEEFVKALDYKVEGGQQLVTGKPVVEISQNGDQWTVKVENEGKVASSSFKLGEPYDEYLPSFSQTYKSVTVKEGDSFKTKTDVTESLTLTRVYEITDSGMTVHLSTNKSSVTAKRFYTRI